MKTDIMELDDSPRKLATITTIESVYPVVNSDRLDVARMKTNSWEVIVGRNELKPGDKCVYFEIDSFLPKEERYAILEGRSNRVMNSIEGYRIKTIKLRGQISQGLIMPLSLFPEIDAAAVQEGDDVTKTLNIKLWQKPINSTYGFAMGYSAGAFPSFVPRTDEIRLQAMSPEHVMNCFSHIMEVTEKVDGTSCTMLCSKKEVANANVEETENNETSNAEVSNTEISNAEIFNAEVSNTETYEWKFMVCGRNTTVKPNGWQTIRWKTEENGVVTEYEKQVEITSVYWDIAAKYDIEQRLTSWCTSHDHQIALQGEIIGPGVQSNRQRLKDLEYRIFNIYDIDRRRYLLPSERETILDEINSVESESPKIPHVPIVEFQVFEPTSSMVVAASRELENNESNWSDFRSAIVRQITQKCLADADGDGLNGYPREGLVYKSCYDPKVSFKVISNKYLLKEED